MFTCCRTDHSQEIRMSDTDGTEASWWWQVSMGTAAKWKAKQSAMREGETQHFEAGHSSAETKRRKRQDQLGPLTACQTHMHAHTAHYFKTVTSRKKKKKQSHQSFMQSYTESQKLKELICLLCGTKKSRSQREFTSQSICTKWKGGICILNGNKVKNEWEHRGSEKIYRFNDSSHYLFWIALTQIILSPHSELPFPKHQAINKQKTQQHKRGTVPHRRIVDAALLSLVKAIERT